MAVTSNVTRETPRAARAPPRRAWPGPLRKSGSPKVTWRGAGRDLLAHVGQDDVSRQRRRSGRRTPPGSGSDGRGAGSRGSPRRTPASSRRPSRSTCAYFLSAGRRRATRAPGSSASRARCADRSTGARRPASGARLDAARPARPAASSSSPASTLSAPGAAEELVGVEGGVEPVEADVRAGVERADAPGRDHAQAQRRVHGYRDRDEAGARDLLGVERLDREVEHRRRDNRRRSRKAVGHATASGWWPSS